MTSDSRFKLTRRTFLQATALAGSAAVAYGATRACNQDLERRQFIVVWLRGGLSPLESFDPKPQTGSEIRGETTAISTSVPDLWFSEFFPRLAVRADRLCVVRGLVPENDRHGLAEASLLSGIAATDAEVQPRESYAVSLAHQFGPRDGMWPNFQIGRDLDARYGGGGVGSLPLVTGPLMVPSRKECPSTVACDFCFPGGVSFQRLVAACGPRPSLSRFGSAWRSISDRLQQLHTTAGGESERNVERLVAAAHRWQVSRTNRELLDLSSEPSRLRTQYGETPLGDDFLQARRLISAGARCVTVTSGGWDHHANIAHEMRTSGPGFDTALAALLDDLEQRCLLATTTVACLSDFGRAPLVNSSGGREHWPQTGICLLAGAGIPRGLVLGRTNSLGTSVCDGHMTPQQLWSFILNLVAA